MVGRKNLGVIPDQKLNLGQRHHDAEGKANELQQFIKGNASHVMGRMELFSPAQQ